jgi:hypothetical protein
MDPRSTKNNFKNFNLADIKKKLYSSQLSQRGVAGSFDHLGGIDLLFETTLGYEPEDHVGSFDEKTEAENLMPVSLLRVGIWYLFSLVNWDTTWFPSSVWQQICTSSVGIQIASSWDLSTQLKFRYLEIPHKQLRVEFPR